VYAPWGAGKQSSAANAPAGQGGISSSYSTSLDIRAGKLNGHEVILLDIESDRVSLPDLGDKTVLKAALVEAKRVSATTVLYRLVGLAVNPKAGEVLSYEEDAPPYSASCTTAKGATVLQINYMDNFVDVFHFRAGEVDKVGSFSRSKEGLIHWTEHLDRGSK
jgi:hypothetical protein